MFVKMEGEVLFSRLSEGEGESGLGSKFSKDRWKLKTVQQSGVRKLLREDAEGRKEDSF